jgi:hypothetical protein
MRKRLCEEVDELVPEEELEDVILKEIGIKDIDELEESDKYLRCLGCRLSKTNFSSSYFR